MARREAERLLKAEIGNLQDSPAPLVCHMTDGEYNSGGDPEPIARSIMQMSVPDGNVLVENCGTPAASGVNFQQLWDLCRKAFEEYHHAVRDAYPEVRNNVQLEWAAMRARRR